MEGISQTLWIVISAVVIIVVALVILTIFGTNIRTVTSLAEVDSLCSSLCQVTCGGRTSGTALVITWSVPMYQVTGETRLYSCAERLKTDCRCGAGP